MGKSFRHEMLKCLEAPRLLETDSYKRTFERVGKAVKKALRTYAVNTTYSTLESHE